MATKSIKIDGLSKQIGVFAAMLGCLLGIIFFVKWSFGNAIASHTIFREVAELAVSLAPNDPQTHYTSAVLLEKNFSADNLRLSLAEYERATALAPNDFRTWLALGKARGRTGDTNGGELALRKSLELAPNYSEIHWVLGNLLLREGKTSEAFAEMRRAADNDGNFVQPTVSIAWQTFDGDLERINQFTGDSSAVNSALVAYLAREKRFDDAVKIWDTLPAEEKKTTFKEDGTILYERMLEAKKYRDALAVQSQIGAAGAENFAVGKIFNGGFEADVSAVGVNFFEWQIADGGQPQIGVDDQQKHGGNRSLTAVFNSPLGRDFRVVSQKVAVEPNRKYVFEMFYKSELKTTATLYWEIADLTDGKILAQTPPISASAAGWTNQKTEFVAPPNIEAVVVRLARETCKTTLCPITGRVWFDDFQIQ